VLQYRASQNPNTIDEKRLNVWQRMADMIANFSGSLIFLTVNVLFFAIWIIANQPGSPIVFDPVPFSFLCIVVSLEAILLSIFVLNSQNRQADKDRIKAESDYTVNLKAELEIGLILKELTELQNRVELLQHDQARMHSSLARTIGDGPRNST